MEKEASWIKNYWRPLMAYQYLLVCLFDFIIAPVMLTVFCWATKTPYIPWEPLTLKESGFYHLSMLGIVGVSAWTRGQEKIKRIMNGDIETIESTKETKVDGQ